MHALEEHGHSQGFLAAGQQFSEPAAAIQCFTQFSLFSSEHVQPNELN